MRGLTGNSPVRPWLREGLIMRLSIALTGIVSIGLATTVLADYKAGLAAYQKGDFKTAVAQVRPSAEQGNPSSQFGMGLMYRNGQGVPLNYQEAFNWFRLSAEQGNAAAQYNLGAMYNNGQGVQKNLAEAVKWYRKSAEQGNFRAQFNLGSMYQLGQGVPQDYKEAARLFRLAAEQKMSVALFAMGGLYFKGHGVPQDYNEAHKWYRQAADQKLPIALIALSGMYANGLGVGKNPVVAYALVDVVASKNAAYAGQRDVLSKKLSAAQLKEASKLSREISMSSTTVLDRHLAAK